MGAGTVGAALGPRGQCWPRATPEEAEGQLPAAQLHAFTEGSSRFSAGTSRSHWAALSQSCHPLQRASSARALSCPAMRRKEGELPLPTSAQLKPSCAPSCRRRRQSPVPMRTTVLYRPTYPWWHVEQEPGRPGAQSAAERKEGHPGQTGQDSWGRTLSPDGPARRLPNGIGLPKPRCRFPRYRSPGTYLPPKRSFLPGVEQPLGLCLEQQPGRCRALVS